MTSDKNQITEWRGKAHFEAGIGIFYGNSGHNDFHKHWAHQIVVGLESEITVYSSERTFTSRAIWIDANEEHSLEASPLLSIYLEPLHKLAKHLHSFKQDPVAPISSIKKEAYSNWLNELIKQADLNMFAEYLKQQYWVPSSRQNSKLEQILLLINHDIINGKNSSRPQLASVANLSASRFSHWFTEQTGIPLRSYKKWLKMLRGVELATQMSLTDAALNAGFSDQAHFCRTVVAALGVSPISVKKILAHSEK